MLTDDALRQLAQSDPARDAHPDPRAAEALLRRVLADPDPGMPRRSRGNAYRSGFEGGSSRRARALWVMAALAPAIAIAYLALTGLRGGSANTPNPRQASSQPLSSVLGVLRGPTITPKGLLKTQVRDDSWGANLALYSQVVPRVHFATLAPWGAGVYVVEPPIDGAPQTGHSRPPASLVEQQIRGDPTARNGLVISGPAPGDPNPQFYGSLSTAAVEAGRALFVQSQSSPSYQGRDTGSGERLLAVVPDGVARVTFILPRQPLPIYGAPVYKRVERITVRVHNNVAVAFVNRPCCWRTSSTLNSDVGPAGPYGTAMVWLDRYGQVLRTAGDVAHTSTVVAMPTPGPETPLSRAAERNLATPNPIEVTPAVGGRTTVFRLHFRALLNGAQYSITSSMIASAPHFDYQHTPCVHSPSDGLGEYPNLVRGAALNTALSHPSNPICPGTYRVTVAVGNLGFPGDYRPGTARPFGAATVVVRSPSGR